ncbi:MAG: prephenate dehydrogenase/arogenate dehydrogenase family protein [Planctomycetota bacterium]
MSSPRYRRAAVVGVGLLGGSVAAALRERGLAERVVGVVRTAERARQTEACGLVDEATERFAAGVADADLIVVATPVQRIAAQAIAAAAHAAPAALVTDVGSTKASIVAAAEAGWPTTDGAPAFVGAHPLAGDHRSGPEAARADLLDGATVVVTPTAHTPSEAVERCEALWQALSATVVRLTPDRHDELLALSSHVPHVAASAVAATTPPEALALAATGWADTTRVAAGGAELWRQILLDNPRPVAAGLRRLAEELGAYADALDAADADTLERLLQLGKDRRDALGS